MRILLSNASGSWSSPTLGGGGRWRAERRGYQSGA
jgi:hypothetical protein